MNYDISVNVAIWPPKYEFLATPLSIEPIEYRNFSKKEVQSIEIY